MIRQTRLSVVCGISAEYPKHKAHLDDHLTNRCFQILFPRRLFVTAVQLYRQLYGPGPPGRCVGPLYVSPGKFTLCHSYVVTVILSVCVIAHADEGRQTGREGPVCYTCTCTCSSSRRRTRGDGPLGPRVCYVCSSRRRGQTGREGQHWVMRWTSFRGCRGPSSMTRADR